MKNKIRVLFINHSVRDGGPGRSLFYILKYLDRNNIEPYILIPKDDYFSDDLRSENLYKNIIIDERFPENIQRPRFNLDYENKPHIVAGVFKIFSVIRNIIDLVFLVGSSNNIVKKNLIDIVYCNGTIAKITGTFIGRRNSVPVIWHVRNIQQTTILKSIFDYLSKFEAVKKIICVSNATAAPYEEVKNKVHVVYNGIDQKEFDIKNTEGVLRKEYSIPKDTVLIGNTGRIVKRKGYKDFIDIARSIIKENKRGVDFKFVIVGDTPYFFPKNHLDELKQYVKELNIEDFFIFTGYKKDIKPYLKEFDIFVIPSNYPDPYPRSVIEAMSFSLPVVGFRIGGIAEAIEDKKTGFLCDPDGFDQMKENIKYLIENSDERKKMGKESRKRVISISSAVDRTRDIEEIILSTYSD